MPDPSHGPDRSPGRDPLASPDPDPATTTGLEPGGGVPPGETPPDSGSVDPGTPDVGSGRRTLTPWLVVGLVVLLAAMLMLLFVGRIVDLT